MTAFYKHPKPWGQVVQQGGGGALIPLAQEGMDKGRIHATQGPARIGLTQGPATGFPDQRSGDGVRPTARILDAEGEALERCKALLGLGNLSSQNKSSRKRVSKDANALQYLENYRVKDHELALQEAVPGQTNHRGSKMRGVGGEGNHDQGSWWVRGGSSLHRAGGGSELSELEEDKENEAEISSPCLRVKGISDEQIKATRDRILQKSPKNS